MFVLSLAVSALVVGVYAKNGVHLVNCNNDDSVVVYCPNDSNCNHNPSPNNFCVFHAGGTGVWEGGQKDCDFPTGVDFTWNIKSGAQSQNLYTYAGSASNSGQKFSCYVDDKHIMYYDSAGRACKSIYYCVWSVSPWATR